MRTLVREVEHRGRRVIVQAICFGVLHADPVGAGVFGGLHGVVLPADPYPSGAHGHARAEQRHGVRVADVGSRFQEIKQTPSTGETVDDRCHRAGPHLAVHRGWFIRRNWRGPDTLTPYEQFEGVGGTPAAGFRAGWRWPDGPGRTLPPAARPGRRCHQPGPKGPGCGMVPAVPDGVTLSGSTGGFRSGVLRHRCRGSDGGSRRSDPNMRHEQCEGNTGSGYPCGSADPTRRPDDAAGPKGW